MHQLKMLQQNMFIILFLVLTNLFFLSCSKSNLPKYVELTDLRVLTLIADSPEVDPGSTVTITPVISDVTEATQLTYSAQGCMDPGVSLGANPSCEKSLTKINLAQGTISSSSNSEMAQNFTGSAPSFTAIIPSPEVIFALRSDQDKFNGVSYLITYEISNSSGTKVTSFKRILVSNKITSEKNQNPIVTQMLSQGSPLATNAYPLNGIFTLSLDINNNSFQNYSVKLESGEKETRTEELTTTWFITDGSVKFFRSSQTDSNEFTAPESLPNNRKSFIISVTRDSRGGVAVKRVCGGCS